MGVLSWVLPTAAIVDAHGLNDRVCARNPMDPAARATWPTTACRRRATWSASSPISHALSKFIVGQRSPAWSPGAGLRKMPEYCDTPCASDRPRRQHPGIPATHRRARSRQYLDSRAAVHIFGAPARRRCSLDAAGGHLPGAFHDVAVVTPTSGEADNCQYAFRRRTWLARRRSCGLCSPGRAWWTSAHRPAPAVSAGLCPAR